MPHAIPEGATIRRDASRLAAVLLESLPSPDMDAARLIPWDSPAQAEALALAVMRGEAHALAVKSSGQLIGQVFYRLSGDTFRLIAAHALPGMIPGEPWSVVLPLTEDYARRAGCSRIVCDTSRPGVLRNLFASGYSVSEVILQKHL